MNASTHCAWAQWLHIRGLPDPVPHIRPHTYLPDPVPHIRPHTYLPDPVPHIRPHTYLSDPLRRPGEGVEDEEDVRAAPRVGAVAPAGALEDRGGALKAIRHLGRCEQECEGGLMCGIMEGGILSEGASGQERHLKQPFP